MKKKIIVGLLCSLSFSTLASEYWYFTHMRNSSGFTPEFRFSGVLQCETRPKLGSSIIYGEFHGDARKGPFKSQSEADNALDRDLERVRLANPKAKLIRANADC